jgi:hypothetical protein
LAHIGKILQLLAVSYAASADRWEMAIGGNIRQLDALYILQPKYVNKGACLVAKYTTCVLLFRMSRPTGYHFCFVFGRLCVQISARVPAILTEAFSSFLSDE